MGKKKSVVLMILLTIVIAVLCAITAFPAFTVPGTNGVKKWNPAVLQYDLGMELGGGYYTYYYPNGVIPESEYKDELNALKTAEKEAAAELADGKITQDEFDEVQEARQAHEDSYAQVEGIGGLYFSTDEDDAVLEETDGKWTVTDAFATAFDKAVNAIRDRYAAKDYVSHRVSVVNGYSVRIQLAASEETENYTALSHASLAFSNFNKMGALTILQDDALVSALEDEDVTAKDLIKSVSIKTKYEVAYLQIKFTSAGKTMISDFKSGDASALTLAIGGETLSGISITSDYITDKNVVEYPLSYQEDLRYAETYKILIESALNTGDIVIGDTDTNFTFRAVSSSEIRTFAPLFNENVLYFIFGAVVAVMVVLMALAIVKMGRFGVVNVYTNLSYFIIAALCFAFVTGGVLELTLGSVLVFLFGLVLINVLHAYTYRAIKKEFSLGKTVESSVKGGYKKTLWGTVDIYVVLLLGSLALLIGAGGLQTLAIQAIVCVLAAAFCNLLWGRVINYTFLSASKNKYKYFRFVREDDDDE